MADLTSTGQAVGDKPGAGAKGKDDRPGQGKPGEDRTGEWFWVFLGGVFWPFNSYTSHFHRFS